MKRQPGAQLLASLRKLMVGLAGTDTDPISHLPLGQLRLLNNLTSGPKTASELAREAGHSASSLSQMVNRLVEIGLVERHDGTEDKRQRLVGLSAEGKRVVDGRNQVRIARADAALSQLSADEAERLLTTLNRLSSHLHADWPESEATFAEIERGS